MKFHMDLSKLKNAKYKKLIERNGTFIDLVELMVGLDVVFYVQTPNGSFIRAADAENKEAKEIQEFLKNDDIKNITFDMSLTLHNKDNKSSVNTIMDELFWNIYQQYMMKKMYMSKESAHEIIQKLKSGEKFDYTKFNKDFGIDFDKIKKDVAEKENNSEDTKSSTENVKAAN